MPIPIFPFLFMRAFSDFSVPSNRIGMESDYDMGKPSSIPFLPISVVALILLRLPWQTLARCRSVCKAWFHLIHSDYFVYQLHLPFSRKTRPFLLRASRFPTSPSLSPFYDALILGVDLDSVSPQQKIHGILPLSQSAYVFSACNGLVCFVERNSQQLSIRIENPATMQGTLLPRPVFGFPVLSSVTCQLLWCRDGESSGFSYKVLLVCYDADDCSTKPSILTVGKDESWRSISSGCNVEGGRGCPPYTLDGCGLEPVCINGTSHFISRHRSYGEEKGGVMSVVGFDIKNEKFRTIVELPRGCPCKFDEKKLEHHYMLMDLRGQLGFLRTRCLTNNVIMDAWLMVEEEGGCDDSTRSYWVKHHSVGLGFMFSKIDHLILIARFVAKIDDERMLIAFLTRSKTILLISYNPISKNVKKIIMEMERHTRSLGEWIGVFAESLVSLPLPPRNQKTFTNNNSRT